MILGEHQYSVSLSSGYAQWWRYNVYIMVIGYDDQDQRVSFESTTDKIYEINQEAEHRAMPPGYTQNRLTTVNGPVCEYIDVYVYVVDNTFPESPIIKDSPPFVVTLSISCDGKNIEESSHEVNQWGGLTLVAHRVSLKR